jgi:hypothetical protein
MSTGLAHLGAAARRPHAGMTAAERRALPGRTYVILAGGRLSMRPVLPWIAVLVVACGVPTDPIECRESSQCDLLPMGMCEASPTGRRWCRYADADCSGGSRWSQLAGDGLAQQCVLAPDGAVADAAELEFDAAELEPDAAELEPDAAELEPDAAEVEPDAAEVEPDAAELEPDAAEIEPDAAVAEHDAAVVEPDAAFAADGAVATEPDATPMQADAAEPVDGPADASPTPDAAPPPAVLTVDPLEKQFGSVIVGMSSPGNFVIRNTGGTSAGPLAVEVSGDNTSSFYVLHDLCSGVVLEPTSKCDITISYTPRTPGAHEASLSISSSMTMAPPVRLAGTATLPRPVVQTSLDSGFRNDVPIGTGFTTSSVALSPDHLQLFAVYSWDETNRSAIPTVSGCGVTWVRIATELTGSDPAIRITLFRAMGSSSACHLTVDFGTVVQGGYYYSWSEFGNVSTSGAHGSSAIRQVRRASTGQTQPFSLTIPMTTIEGNGAFSVWGFWAVNGWPVITPAAGWTEIHQVGNPGQKLLEIQWRPSSTSYAAVSNDKPDFITGIAVEIQAADVFDASTHVTHWEVDSGTAALVPGMASFALTNLVTATSARLQLLCVVSQDRETSPASPSTPMASGAGLSWSHVATRTFNNSGSPLRLTLFRALGTPSTGRVIVDFGGIPQVMVAWAWSEFGRVNTSSMEGAGAITQSATNGTGALTATSLQVMLGPLSSKNSEYSCWGFANASAPEPRTVSPDPGWAEVHLEEPATIHLQTQWRDVATDRTASVASSQPDHIGGIAVEIRAAAAP